MMEIRFVLNEQFDAGLIARIQEKSNGCAHNLTARFLMRHWYENEINGFSPSQRQQSDAGTSDTDDDLDTNVAALIEDWG